MMYHTSRDKQGRKTQNHRQKFKMNETHFSNRRSRKITLVGRIENTFYKNQSNKINTVTHISRAVRDKVKVRFERDRLCGKTMIPLLLKGGIQDISRSSCFILKKGVENLDNFTLQKNKKKTKTSKTILKFLCSVHKEIIATSKNSQIAFDSIQVT